MLALREKQNEEIAKTMFIAMCSMSDGKDEKNLNNALKRYIDAADPFIGAERKRKDSRLKKMLENEVQHTIKVYPTAQEDKQISLRKKPRLRRKS